MIEKPIVWITGASSGIGEALAYGYAKEGCRLIISSRRVAELERVKSTCIDLGAPCTILQLDLEKQEDFDAIAQQAWETYGHIDILINNGGMSQRSRILESSMEIYRKLFEVNFFGTIAITKAVLPYMVARKKGHIAVVSSIAGLFGFPLRSAYSAAKHALMGFFETLRLEHIKDNIGVTIICPGRVKTNISVNAINANNTAHGKMDTGQQNGISAESCAQQIIYAIDTKKKEVWIGKLELLPAFLKRYFPSLFYFVIQRVKAE